MCSASSPAGTSVLVLDDHRTVTEMLGMAIEAHHGLSFVGGATTLEEALAMLERIHVDVLVLDYRLGGVTGIDAARTVMQRWPEVAVVMFTAYPTRTLMTEAAAAGASALMPKDGALDDLLRVLLAVRPGEFTVPPPLLKLLMTQDHHDSVVLTAREVDVLACLAEGHDVRVISRTLAISIHTARGHVKSILSKLGVHSQLEAVAQARRHGLLGAREE